MRVQLSCFFSARRGAAASDWVVLTAGIVGLGLIAANALGQATLVKLTDVNLAIEETQVAKPGPAAPPLAGGGRTRPGGEIRPVESDGGN